MRRLLMEKAVSFLAQSIAVSYLAILGWAKQSEMIQARWQKDS